MVTGCRHGSTLLTTPSGVGCTLGCMPLSGISADSCPNPTRHVPRSPFPRYRRPRTLTGAGRRVLLCQVCACIGLRVLPDVDVESDMPRHQSPCGTLLYCCTSLQSWQLPLERRLPPVQLRHVHGHAGRCGIHQLARRAQDIARHVLVRSRRCVWLALRHRFVRPFRIRGGPPGLVRRRGSPLRDDHPCCAWCYSHFYSCRTLQPDPFPNPTHSEC